MSAGPQDRSAAAPGDGLPYRGPEALRGPLVAALRDVVDPELALDVVDLGLIVDLVCDDDGLRLAVTMTSAACPVADLLLDDLRGALERVSQGRWPVRVDLVWAPAWTPERIHPRARALLGWPA